MNRFFAIGILILTTSFSGCVGWGPNGNEQFIGPLSGAMSGVCTTCDDHCHNCDGYNPPFGNVRKTLACGSGCGEIYYGEWLSNPPNTCNECDARGHAFGMNARIPWLCNPFHPWGFKYRENGAGYGNPLRGTHRGLGDYGGYRAGYWNRVGVAGNCSSGCGSGKCATGNCGTGNCAPNAPKDGGKLKPIPQSKNQPAKQVNYVSPLVKAKYGRISTK